MVSALRNYKVLLADSDLELGHVLKKMLVDMGFIDMHVTRSGQSAIKMLAEKNFDFLITEKNTEAMDGIELTKHIRSDKSSPNPVMPIVMLAGSAEEADVIAARDAGINEYLVKPFSAKTIYSRLERIIEYPRQFVVSQNFIGPTRRHKAAPPPGTADRRTISVTPQLGPKNPAGLVTAGKQPIVWLANPSLKLKLGSGVSLSSLITPEILDQAQAGVDAITDQSLQWIKNNLEELKAMYAAAAKGDCSQALADKMKDTLLLINSRAGTFGYTRASQIAYKLYLFCRNKLDLENENHHVVIKKFIDVLQIILGNQMKGNADELGKKIAAELDRLVHKYDH